MFERGMRNSECDMVKRHIPVKPDEVRNLLRDDTTDSAVPSE
jgi:hypothetical protein